MKPNSSYSWGEALIDFISGPTSSLAQAAWFCLQGNATARPEMNEGAAPRSSDLKARVLEVLELRSKPSTITGAQSLQRSHICFQVLAQTLSYEILRSLTTCRMSGLAASPKYFLACSYAWLRASWKEFPKSSLLVVHSTSAIDVFCFIPVPSPVIIQDLDDKSLSERLSACSSCLVAPVEPEAWLCFS